MLRQQHYYGPNHLHFLTANTYRRARIFDSDRFKGHFTRTLNDLRAELGFRIIGYVSMPEHCHFLIWPSELADPSQIMQKLAERTANLILRTLRRNLESPWCQRMLARFELPATVHHHAHYRVWQRGGYDLNIWSEKKRIEKLDYVHNNPVKRGLVKTPGNWPGQAGGSITWGTRRFWQWIGCREEVEGPRSWASEVAPVTGAHT